MKFKKYLDRLNSFSGTINFLIGILELVMLIGIFIVLRQRFIDIQISAYLLFLYSFFLWALIIVAVQLFPRKTRSSECLGRHVQVYLTILVISLGLISGISYLMSNRPFVPIPNLRGGTFGLRSWNCLVRIEDISVKVQNPVDSTLIVIDQRALLDSINWVRAFPQTPIPDSTIVSMDRTKVSDQYIIVDCGGVFFDLDKIGLQAGVRNGCIEAIVVFNEAETGNKDNPNIEFNMRVPWDAVKHKPSSDLYIGLQTFLLNPEWSKCWIPALALAPSKLHNDSSLLIRKSTGFDKYEYGVPYKLRAVWFDDYAGLYVEHISSGVSGTLYEGRFADDK